MFIRKKKYPSGNIGMIVTEKVKGRIRELKTIGIASDASETEALVPKGREWIEHEQSRLHPQLDLFGEENAGRTRAAPISLTKCRKNWTRRCSVTEKWNV